MTHKNSSKHKEILSGIGSAHIFVNLKPDFEQKNGLSPGYCRAEGKYVIKQMLNFDSLYMHNNFSTRSDNLEADWQKARF